MKAVLIAAGYATRLTEVTNNGEIAKTLLPIEVDGKQQPILHFLLDKLVKIPALDEIVVVVNDKYEDQITKSINEYGTAVPVKILSDGTTTPPARGANVALQIANNYITETNPDYIDDILVLGSDNYFEFELSDFESYYQQLKADYGDDLNLIASKEYPEEEREFISSHYGILDVDLDNYIYALMEKPGKVNNFSNTVSLALYMFNRPDFGLIDEYLEKTQSNKSRDSLGYFINYIIKNSVAYAYPVAGKFLDIGSKEEYYEIAPKNGLKA